MKTSSKSKKSKTLEPALHKNFVESCLYQPTEASGKRHYGFGFIARSMQKKVQSMLIHVFESDLVFNKTNKAYRSERQEPVAWTNWYRQMAETVCQEGFWDTLRQHAKSPEAVDTIKQLQRNHQTHALFAHHTTESLLYVGRFVLPPLQRQCRRAERTFQRWSKFFFWLPDAFKTHYKHYLTTLRDNVNAIQSGLTLSLQHRLTLAEQSPDLKTDDVLFSLIGQLRQAVPDFLSDEQLVQVLEPPSSTNDAFMRAFDKKFSLPTQRRQSTFQAQAECVAFLHADPQSRAWVNTWLDKKNRHASSPIPLRTIQNNQQLMVIPEAWLQQNSKFTSFKKLQREQPWLKHWTLSHGMQCLRAQEALKRLTPAPGDNPFSGSANTAFLFDDFDAVTEAQAMLKTHQDTAKKIPLKSAFSWWPFSKKRITQKKALEKHIAQIEVQVQALEHAKIAWALTHFSCWQALSRNMTAKEWDSILKRVWAILHPTLKNAKRHNPQLVEVYRQLCILSAPVCSNADDPLLKVSVEVKVFTSLSQLANGQTLSETDWQSLQTLSHELNQRPSLKALWQKVCSGLLFPIKNKWLAEVSPLCQTTTAADVMFSFDAMQLGQMTQVLRYWSENMFDEKEIQSLYEKLWGAYLRLGSLGDEKAKHTLEAISHVLIHGKGAFAQKAQVLDALRQQESSLQAFQQACLKRLENPHYVEETLEAKPVENSPSKDKAKQSPKGTPLLPSQKDTNPSGSNQTRPSEQPAIPSPFSLTLFIDVFKQMLLGQGTPPLRESAVKAFLNVANTMKQDAHFDIATWEGQKNLEIELCCILHLYPKKRSFFSRLSGKPQDPKPQLKGFVRERQQIVNMIARASYIAELPLVQQREQVALLQQDLNQCRHEASSNAIRVSCEKLLSLVKEIINVLPQDVPQAQRATL